MINSARLLATGFGLFGIAQDFESSAQTSITVGMDRDGNRVIVFDDAGNTRHDFSPFNSGFVGGVRVASGDVNTDGQADIIVAAGPGAGAGAHVRVFNGDTGALIHSFFAYDAGFTGGVYVATGDVNGDGTPDIITGPGRGGGPHVKIFDGATAFQMASFEPYPQFNGGIFVAAGDVSGDGRADIIVAPASTMAPVVNVFDGGSLAQLQSFLAFDKGFTGGVHVAAGDWNGDGRSDIIVGAGPGAGAAAGGGPHVRVFDGLTFLPRVSFLAFQPNFIGGVRVSAGDVNGDGLFDIITAPGDGAPASVSLFYAPNGEPNGSFSVFGRGYTGGVFVATDAFVPIVFRNGFEP